jgi:nitroreductase
MPIEPIVKRRSVRFYTDREVPMASVYEILAAGFCAPSAHGRSPWHVVLVRDKEKLRTLSGIHKWTRHLARAPIALVICAERDSFDRYWVEDASAFMENVLIQAAAMGIGSCWIGLRQLVHEGVDAEALVRQTCLIPDSLGIVGITPVGYASREPETRVVQVPRERVHADCYGTPAFSAVGD